MNTELRYEEKTSISKIIGWLFTVLMYNLIVDTLLSLAGGTYGETTDLTSLIGIASSIFMIIYGILLIKLEQYSVGYKPAGILCIILAGVNTITLFLTTDNKVFTVIITITVLIIQIIKEFKEIDAHTYMMKKIHSHELNWEKVSGLLTAYVSISIIAVVLSPLFGTIGALLTLVAAIIYLVYTIKKWIYIKRMGNIFKESAETFEE